MIFTESFNLDFQLRNIFATAEIEAGETDLSISNLDIISLILNSIDSFKHQADEKKVEILFLYDWLEGSDKELYFRTDPEKFRLIVNNILANAIEFSNEDGEVQIKLWKDSDMLNISVEDSGIGMDPKDHDIIFDRFKQIDEGSTKKHKGHGLGLSIVKALTDLLNANIDVKSEKGKGSVFTVTLPELEGNTSTDVFSSDGNEFLFEEDSEEEY
ncbi:ATP-binding region, ATPase-like domain protein [Candidatus Magnetoovum chiemensis]|nr:ATP-binding region, ATPase-like domain protein [Candidatus Magnetoovum chiemensis]